MSANLGGAAVAITGASGFIGARLAAILATGPAPPRLRLLSRRRDGAESRVADFTNPEEMTAALEHCRAVVHCAFDFQNLPVNVAIARALGRACVTLGLRLVHVSTAAVHEPFFDGMLDETAEIGPGGSAYKRIKLAIEAELLDQVRDSGLDLVILQPTVVYGPGGRAWTDSPIRELLTGAVVLPARGNGLCNAVYVDDVCQAVIAAMTAPVASGQRILVSGSHPVAWKEFYGAYRTLLGVGCLRLSSDATPAVTNDAPIADGISVSHRVKQMLSGVFGGKMRSRLNLLVSYGRSIVTGGRDHLATGDKLALFQSRCHVQIDTAQRLLGYQPAFDLERGMAMTSSYVVQTYGLMARLRAIRG